MFVFLVDVNIVLSTAYCNVNINKKKMTPVIVIFLVTYIINIRLPFLIKLHCNLMYCNVSNSTVSTVCNCTVNFNLTILIVTCIINIRLPFFNLIAL